MSHIQPLSAASKGDIVFLSKTKNLRTCEDKYGATPVHYAARTGKVECVQWLVEIAGLSSTKAANNGATPVHDAAATGKLDCLQWLIENGGCSETERDKCGATPLHLAARFGHLNIVTWLVEFKHCSALDKAHNGVTPVHLAAAKGSINCLKWLSQTHPSSVNKQADNGTTPAYFAAQEGKLDCLKFLVTEADADLEIRASDGMLPLHAAAQLGHLDCLSWMVENRGLSVNERDNDGATVMHFAAARGHIDILQWLLSRGYSLKTDDLGGTPLHDAAEHGQLEALKVLVASGMDIQVRDLDGLTPADLARECGNTDCADFLNSPAQIRSTLANAKDLLQSNAKRGTSDESHDTDHDHPVEDSSKYLATKSLPNVELDSAISKKHLLSEVREFEPDALRNVSQKKKNLHMNLGHIRSMDSGESSNAASEDQKKSEQEPNVPIWKASLMKKREEKGKSEDQEVSQRHFVKTEPVNIREKRDIPTWKQMLIEKRERKKAEDSVLAATQSLTTIKNEEKKDKFDSLPEWKKKLILQKQAKLK